MLMNIKNLKNYRIQLAGYWVAYDEPTPGDYLFCDQTNLFIEQAYSERLIKKNALIISSSNLERLSAHKCEVFTTD